MGVQQSSKQGVQSESQKRDTARYMEEPAPNAAPVAGAFGREQEYPDEASVGVLAADEDEEDEDFDDEDDEDDEDDDYDDDDDDDDDLEEDEDEE